MSKVESSSFPADSASGSTPAPQRSSASPQGSRAVSANLAITQTINFTRNDESNSEDITAMNVVISSSAGDHDHGSSKVKFKNIVDYIWEHKIHNGQLLAIHMDGKFLAYSIKAAHQQSGPRKGNGMVRVAYSSTQKRVLLKGMTGQVQDLAFAYITSQILLGCIDETGNVFIHKIALESDTILHSLLLHVSVPSIIGSEHRILWCPYIPDAEDIDTDAEDDCAKLLLVTHGNKAYIWNVGTVSTKFGSGSLSLKELGENYQSIEDHTQPIVDAAFSPDGTSLATASYDGFVMFFQVCPKIKEKIYMNVDTPRCLYRWSPHDGKPLSSIFFLDNRNITEQFWKFVVTGADKNSVLKIWSCQSWACLQTIIFAPSPKHPTIALKAGLDQTAKYLLLSDIYRRALFILHFDHSSESSVYCRKISEFYLPNPILCFGIVDTTLKRLKCPSSCSDVYHQSNIYHSPAESPDGFKEMNSEENGTDDLLSNGHEVDVDSGCNIRTMIRLYLIQPNRLQEGQITFSPFSASSALDKTLNNTFMNDTSEFKEGLTDISQDMDVSAIMSPTKSTLYNEKDEASEQLKSVLVQQSQQLKNLLMRTQIPTSGFMKQPPSPLVSGSIANMPYGPLLTSTATSTAASAPIQPPLNLMTPDAFSTAKQDEEDPPISQSPIICPIPSAPALEIDMKLNNQANIDPVVQMNAETLNSLSNKSRGFVGNQSTPADPKFASGGSSPSREVQEILSLKGSDFFDDDDINDDDFEVNIKEQTPRIEQVIPSLQIGQGLMIQSPQEGFQAFNAGDDDVYITRINHMLLHNTSKHTSGEMQGPTVWPSINLAKINEANQRKSINDNSDKSSTHSKSNCNSVNVSNMIDLMDDTGGADKHQNRSPTQNNDMEILISKVDSLVGLMHDQQKELSVLKGDVSNLRILYQNKLSNNDDNSNIADLLEQALLRNHVQFKQIVDSVIASKIDSDRSNRESLLSGVSQIIGAQFAEKLNASVTYETRNTLCPLVQRILEPIVNSIQLEVSKKLTATDHLLAENIQKMVNSKAVMDNLCIAISHSVATSTKEAFKQTIQSSLIPHVEKAQSQMFKQLNQSFNSGTKEYLSAFEGCSKRIIEYTGTVDDTLAKVKTISSQLQTILDQQSKQSGTNSQMQQTIKQLNNLSKELQGAVSNSLQGALENQLTPIKECIKEQISSGMAAQAAQLEDSLILAVRSGTQTPAPSMIDTHAQQNHIESLLNSGQMNSAFQYALSASDLKLVVYACSAADLKQVFSSPCSLQPNVLLSLIQQLSADMTSDTELKCKYLAEAVMYLDYENPLTKEHMPIVLKELRKQLSVFLRHNPNNASSRHLKLLLLATDSLLKS